MKILLSGSAIFLLIIVTSLGGGLTSCTKDKTIYDTVTVNHTDTLIIKDTTLTTEILTSHPWKIKELRGVMEGTIIYYLRGGVSNTLNYDNEYLLFNTDKSGTYLDGNSAVHPITWDFANDEHTKLTFTIHDSPATFTITWENIRYKNNSLYYDEYYKDGNTGGDWHGQGIRIPK